MSYIIEVWKKGALWYAKTPDGDTFRHTSLVSAIGQIFTRVNAGVQYVPHHLMEASIEEVGEYMLKNSASCNVSITCLVQRMTTEEANAAQRDSAEFQRYPSGMLL